MKTLSRTLCPLCNKINLCTFPSSTDDTILMQCKTLGCANQNAVLMNNSMPINNHAIQRSSMSADLVFQDFTEDYRGLTPETTKRIGITRALLNNQEVIRYEHKNLNGTSSFKLRWPGKKFSWSPELPNTNMFNLSNCTDFTRPIILTEGNEDCGSWVQLGYQSASFHSGDTVQKNITEDLETLNKFPEIYLSIENDHVGIPAKNIIKKLLAHKLLKEIDHGRWKDANEILQLGGTDTRQRFLDMYSTAQEVTPKGVIFGNQINKLELFKPLPPGLKVPYPKLQEMTHGILPGNLWVLTAGVSIGKSSVLRDFSVYLKKQQLKVGNIYVEEDAKVAQLNYIATELGYPIGEVLENPEIIPKEEREEAFQRLLNDPNLMFIDENWEQSNDNLLNTIRYLGNVKKYDIILLDHLTALCNFSKISKAGKVHDIDYLMEQLFQVARQTGTRILLVSHLKRVADSPNWDEGRKPSMYDLRGSSSVEGKPDVIIGLSRNMKNEALQDRLQLEVLKNRWFARLGDADTLFYINDTGRLKL